MSAMAPQITSLKTLHWTDYSGTDPRKYQSSASLAFVQDQYRGKSLDLMTSSWILQYASVCECA